MLKYTDCSKHLETLVSNGGYSYDGNEIELSETLLSLTLDKEISKGLIPEQTILTGTFDNWFVEEPIELWSDISHRIMKFRLTAEELIEIFKHYDGGPIFWPCDSFEVVDWNSFPITDNFIPKKIIELFSAELAQRCGDGLSEYETELENGELDNFPEAVVKAVKAEVDRYRADAIENPPKKISRWSPLTHDDI